MQAVTAQLLGMLLPYLNLLSQPLLPEYLVTETVLWEQAMRISPVLYLGELLASWHNPHLLYMTAYSIACRGTFVLSAVRYTVKLKPSLNDTHYLDT